MSILVQAWVFAHSDAKLADRLVLLAIADEADDDGKNAYPSQRRIAQKARLAVNTARAAIDRLEDAQEILVRRPERQGRGHHSEYVVLMGRDAGDVAVEVGWAEGSKSGHLLDVEERAETRGNARPKVDTDPLTHRPLDQEHARKTFPEFDALVEVFGEPGTKQEAGFYAKTARSLRDQGKSPQDIRRRAEVARKRWPDCSVASVVNRWAQLTPPPSQSKWDALAEGDLANLGDHYR